MKAPKIEVEGNIGYGEILPHVIHLLINEKCLSRASKADQHGWKLQLDKHVKEELDPYGLRVVICNFFREGNRNLMMKYKNIAVQMRRVLLHEFPQTYQLFTVTF